MMWLIDYLGGKVRPFTVAHHRYEEGELQRYKISNKSKCSTTKVMIIYLGLYRLFCIRWSCKVASLSG